MKSGTWKTYRTRFLVKARRLSSNLTFIDSLGRQHCGRKGDYLVESLEGVLSITPRQIFEDIYVAMGVEVQDLENRVNAIDMGGSAESNPAARKLPQPCRGRLAPGSRVGIM